MCTTGDTAHIDTIFKLWPHTCQRVWQQLEYRIYVCRVTRGSHIISSYQKKKNFFQFSCGCDRHMFSVPGSTAKQRQKSLRYCSTTSCCWRKCTIHINSNRKFVGCMMTGIRFLAKDGIFPFVIIRHPEDVGRKLPRNVGNYRRNYTMS